MKKLACLRFWLGDNHGDSVGPSETHRPRDGPQPSGNHWP